MYMVNLPWKLKTSLEKRENALYLESHYILA